MLVKYELLLGMSSLYRHLKAAEKCRTAAEVVGGRIAIVHQCIQRASFTVSEIGDRSERSTSGKLKVG